LNLESISIQLVALSGTSYLQGPAAAERGGGRGLESAPEGGVAFSSW